MKKKTNTVVDKYWYYRHSVQSPDIDVEFFHSVYKEINKKNPMTLREDFCGAFAVCCEWVKLKKGHYAIGVDLDPEPIAYGLAHYSSELTDSEQQRIEILQENVLSENLPKADIIVACNFSYYIFKTREQLKAYFTNAYRGLPKDGIFIIDCFGGSECYAPSEEETVHDTFSYFWDQDSFDPVTNQAMFHIHYKPKGQKKFKAFSYDWRMWSIPELKELLEEIGFTKVHIYWEGTDKNGDGNGEYKKVNTGEDCESWVAYLVCEK